MKNLKKPFKDIYFYFWTHKTNSPPMKVFLITKWETFYLSSRQNDKQIIVKKTQSDVMFSYRFLIAVEKNIIICKIHIRNGISMNMAFLLNRTDKER